MAHPDLMWGFVHNGTVTMIQRRLANILISGLAFPALILTSFAGFAQERPSWERSQPAGPQRQDADEDVERPVYQPRPAPYQGGGYPQPRSNDVYAAPAQGGYGAPQPGRSHLHASYMDGRARTTVPTSTWGASSWRRGTASARRRASTSSPVRTLAPARRSASCSRAPRVGAPSMSRPCALLTPRRTSTCRARIPPVRGRSPRWRATTRASPMAERRTPCPRFPTRAPTRAPTRLATERRQRRRRARSTAIGSNPRVLETSLSPTTLPRRSRARAM